MSVQVLTKDEAFPNYEKWTEFEQLIAESISGESKCFAEERGALKDNILENCKHHNMAVNAKFDKPVNNNRFGLLELELKQALSKSMPDASSQLRNYTLYRPGDYMGWHTNKLQPGIRYYLIWAEEADKSYFDYLDANNDIQTIAAPAGWSVNKFTCGDESNMFTHQVRTDTNRLSIGFRLR